MIPQLLVLSSNAMLVLDQRTLAIKYRIPTSEFECISLSPYPDRLAVFHLKKVIIIIIQSSIPPFLHGPLTTSSNEETFLQDFLIILKCPLQNY